MRQEAEPVRAAGGLGPWAAGSTLPSGYVHSFRPHWGGKPRGARGPPSKLLLFLQGALSGPLNRTPCFSEPLRKGRFALLPGAHRDTYGDSRDEEHRSGRGGQTTRPGGS